MAYHYCFNKVNNGKNYQPYTVATITYNMFKNIPSTLAEKLVKYEQDLQSRI